MVFRLRELPRYWGELTAVQEEFERACESPRVVLRCGRQVGKTEYLARRTVRNLLCGKRVWWLAPTHQLCRVGFQRCVHLVNKLPDSVRRLFKLKRSAPFRVSFGEAYVDFLTTRNADSLQGETLDEVVIDEAATVRDLLRVIDERIEPTLVVRRGRLILASTPRGLNEFAELCKSPYWREVHAPTSANPLVSMEWLRQQRERYESEGRLYYYLQEFEAEILSDVGLFFERLPEVVDALPEASGYDVCGIDWGYSAPFAAVYLLVKDSVVYVGREVYARRLNADEQARRVLSVTARVYVADASTPEQVLEAWRIQGLAPLAGSRDRSGGWDLIRQLIREGRMKVHRECIHLLDEFQSAQVDERKPDDLVGEDHALDALRYAILHAFNLSYRQQRLQAYREQLAGRLSADAVSVALADRARSEYIKRARREGKRRR
jgi:hypothetical protein